MQTPTLNTMVLFVFSSLAISGCVSVPEAVDKQPTSLFNVADVQQNEANHTSSQVRWGGTIVGLSNNSDSTDILVVSRPLGKSARPLNSDRSSGRFIARVAGFVEPEVYVKGREITITGAVEGLENKLIGETEYQYPVVAVDGLHLWNKREPAKYPYHRHHPFHHRHDHWFDDHHGPGSFIHGQFIFRQDNQ